jgi:hypothetical protein
MRIKPRAIGIAWFRAEDYQRIREISDGEMIGTFEEFEARMAARLPGLLAGLPEGTIIEKVIVDPDELLAFARKHHGGRIDSGVRSEFVGRVMAQKYGTEH